MWGSVCEGDWLELGHFTLRQVRLFPLELRIQEQVSVSETEFWWRRTRAGMCPLRAGVATKCSLQGLCPYVTYRLRSVCCFCGYMSTSFPETWITRLVGHIDPGSSCNYSCRFGQDNERYSCCSHEVSVAWKWTDIWTTWDQSNTVQIWGPPSFQKGSLRCYRQWGEAGEWWLQSGLTNIWRKLSYIRSAIEINGRRLIRIWSSTGSGYTFMSLAILRKFYKGGF
jgi:hypothetical protein